MTFSKIKQLKIKPGFKQGISDFKDSTLSAKLCHFVSGKADP